MCMWVQRLHCPVKGMIAIVHVSICMIGVYENPCFFKRLMTQVRPKYMIREVLGLKDQNSYGF